MRHYARRDRSSASVNQPSSAGYITLHQLRTWPVIPRPLQDLKPFNIWCLFEESREHIPALSSHNAQFLSWLGPSPLTEVALPTSPARSCHEHVRGALCNIPAQEEGGGVSRVSLHPSPWNVRFSAETATSTFFANQTPLA